MKKPTKRVKLSKMGYKGGAESEDNCPECHLKQYVKRAGHGKRANGERFQKYYCRSCKRWFRGE